MVGKDTKEKRNKIYDIGEKHKNRKYLQCITRGLPETNIGRRRTSPITRIDKVEKKQLKREGKWRFIKYLNEKRKGETLPKSGLP